MGIKDKIGESIIWWSLSMIVAGFLAGIGAYATGMSVFGWEPVQKGSYLSKSDVEAHYIKSEIVNSNFFPRKCASMKNYPVGVWVQLKTDLGINQHNPGEPPNAVIPSDITLIDPTHGTWYEGLGKAVNGQYPKTVIAPLSLSKVPAPGEQVDAILAHADLTNEKIATDLDRHYVSKSSLLVTEDGCMMSGSFRSEPVSGTVVLCWQTAQLLKLCPAIAAKPSPMVSGPR